MTVDSIAADSLGARRATALAVHAAPRAGARSVLVSDAAIVAARRALWEERRVVVEHAAAAALAGLAAYRPADGERVVVVLCGGNTDPGDLPEPPASPQRATTTRRKIAGAIGDSSNAHDYATASMAARRRL